MTTRQDPSAAPTVSIVIPAHNHGQFVAEAIESVLSQDYPAIQLIVIDDGSTDNTRQVLAEYVRRAQVVHQENAGQSAAINRGWADAVGEVVSYLSADDRLEPKAVSTAIEALEDHPQAVVVYGDYDLIDPTSNFVRRVTAPTFDSTEMVQDLVCAPGPGVFIRRSAVRMIDGWNTQLRQMPDFDYWLRLSLLGPFVKCPRVLAALRVHPGSASYADTSPARAEEPLRIMESYFGRANLPSHVRVLQRRSMSSAHLLAARFHLRAGRFGPAALNTRAAMALSPANVLSARAGRLLVNSIANRAGHRLLWGLRRVWAWHKRS